MFFYWHDKKLYPFLGSLLLAVILFFNFYDGHLTHLFLPFSWLQPSMAFVRRNATHFHVANPHRNASLPLYVNGWNSYWFLEELASGAPDSRAKVSRMLRKGREMGMGVCRTWAFSDGGVNALQISPGKFDPDVFEALDYVIYEARRNRVWLILSLVNNLNAFGGKEQYVKWAKAAGVNVSDSGDEFFWDPTIKGYYRNYVKAILSRKNSYSGVRYSDEPAIFAWELVNEPRCASNSSAPLLQAWIVEMASYIKSLDKNHLVTVGLEGFYGPGWSERAMTNPGEWAASLGSDFIQNSAIADIDFASVHAYPDSWLPNATLEEKATYLAHWVDAHVNDSEHILKKPVLFTEVGSYLNTKSQGSYDRDVLLKAVYERMYKSAKEGRAGAGAFIWQLMVEGTLRFGDRFSLVAKDHPTTYTLIVQQSCRLRYMLSGANNRKQKIKWPCDGVQL